MVMKQCDWCGKVDLPAWCGSIHITPAVRHIEDPNMYGFHGDFCIVCFRKLSVGIAEMMLRRMDLEGKNESD